MKNTSIALTALVLSCSAVALALDVPSGGDALGHQLRGSTSAAIAQLVAQGPTLVFRTAKAVSGRVPSDLKLAADEYVRSLPLKKGAWYLLFLEAAPRGGYGLALSRYSIVAAEPDQAAEYRRVIADYRRAQGNREAFRKVALPLLGSTISHLQYSAMSDLSRRGLFTRGDGSTLSRLALDRSGQPEVRKLAFRQLGVLGVKAEAGAMGKSLGDPSEPVSVRMAALDGLSFMGETEVISSQASAISTERSPKLKTRTLESISKR